jgi:mannose-6-phosphate isomerase-like protein (cupin superfamily)
MMTHNVRVAVASAIAFAAGFAASHLSAPVRAAAAIPAPAVTPKYYPDLAQLHATPGRPVPIAQTPTSTAVYLVGSIPAHTHPVATELQYVIAGHGTEQFGSCFVRIRPGTFLVIPPNYGHSGMRLDAGSEPLRLIAVKTPVDTNKNGTPPPITCQR